MNRAKFYDEIRGKFNLTEQNVDGFEHVLDYAEQHGTPLAYLANILGQSFWETGGTMQPVTEAYWKSEAWRKRNLRYWPWHGRGLIQTTWERNYKAVSKLVSKVVGYKVDFTKNPDLLLEWPYALPALFEAMEAGLYTGKKLSDYIDNIDESDAEDYREFKNARRIVNGTDKDDKLAGYSITFEHALRASGYGTEKPKPTPEPTTPEPKQSLLVRLLLAILRLFKP